MGLWANVVRASAAPAQVLPAEVPPAKAPPAEAREAVRVETLGPLCRLWLLGLRSSPHEQQRYHYNGREA